MRRKRKREKKVMTKKIKLKRKKKIKVMKKMLKNQKKKKTEKAKINLKNTNTNAINTNISIKLDKKIKLTQKTLRFVHITLIQNLIKLKKIKKKHEKN